VKNAIIVLLLIWNICLGYLTFKIPSPIPELPEIHKTSWSDKDWMMLQVWRQLTRHWATRNCVKGDTLQLTKPRWGEQ